MKRLLHTSCGAPALVGLSIPGVAAAETMEVTTVEELRSALNQATAGDEIVVADGEYALERPLSASLTGSEDLPVVVRAASGAAPVLSTASGALLELTGSFVQIDGLTFRGGDPAIAASGGSFAFERLTLEGGARGIICDECLSVAVSTTEFDGVGPGEAVAVTGASDVFVGGNWAHALSGDGLVVEAQTVTVADNVVELDAEGDGIRVTNLSAGDDSTLVEGNFVRGGALVAEGGAFVVNNIVWESARGGIVSNAGEGSGTADVEVLHNTVVDAADGCFVAVDWPLVAGGTIVANNALYCAGGTAVRFESGTSENLVMQDNVYLGMADFAGDSVLGGSLEEDFEAASEGNFYPSGMSPLVDGGDAFYTTPSDFDATPRAGTPDVGAYERTTTENPFPIPGGGFKGASSPAPGADAGGDGGETSDVGGGSGSIGRVGGSGTGFPERDDGGCNCGVASSPAHASWLIAVILGLMVRARRGAARR